MKELQPQGMVNSEARKRIEEHQAMVAPFVDLPKDTISLPVDLAPVRPYAVPSLDQIKHQIQKEARVSIREMK